MSINFVKIENNLRYFCNQSELCDDVPFGYDQNKEVTSTREGNS